jgi:hypothetical protein
MDTLTTCNQMTFAVELSGKVAFVTGAGDGVERLRD